MTFFEWGVLIILGVIALLLYLIYTTYSYDLDNPRNDHQQIEVVSNIKSVIELTEERFDSIDKNLLNMEGELDDVKNIVSRLEEENDKKKFDVEDLD